MRSHKNTVRSSILSRLFLARRISELVNTLKLKHGHSELEWNPGFLHMLGSLKGDGQRLTREGMLRQTQIGNEIIEIGRI